MIPLFKPMSCFYSGPACRCSDEHRQPAEGDGGHHHQAALRGALQGLGHARSGAFRKGASGCRRTSTSMDTTARVRIEDVHVHSFETHCIEMSYFSELMMRDLEIRLVDGGSVAFLSGEYDYARWLLECIMDAPAQFALDIAFKLVIYGGGLQLRPGRRMRCERLRSSSTPGSCPAAVPFQYLCFCVY